MDELFQDEIQNSESPPSFDFQKLLIGVWKRKLLIIFLAIIIAIPFYYHASKKIPIYRCNVLLRAERMDDNSRYFNSIRQAEMKSRPFVNRVAAKVGNAITLRDSVLKNYSDVFSEHHTTFDPVPGFYSISISAEGVYSLHFLENGTRTLIDSSNVWDAVHSFRHTNGLIFRLTPQFAQMNRSIKIRVRPFEKAVNELMYTLRVNFNNALTIMGLTLEGTDPDVLAEKLNIIAETYIEEMNALLAKDNSKYKDNLEKQLRTAEAEVKKLESDVRVFNSKYPLSLDAKKKELENELRENARKLRTLPLQQQKLDELLASLQNNGSTPDSSKYRKIIIRQLSNFEPMQDEPTLSIFKESLLRKEEELGKIIETYGPAHPVLMALEQDINELNNQIIDFASRYRNILAEEESYQRSKEKELKDLLSELPYEEQRQNELERNQKIVENLYSLFFTKMQELQLNDAVESKGIEIFEPAVRPSSSINPGTKASILIGGGLGALLGILISVVLDLLDTRIRTINEVEKHLKLSVIGAIPIIEFKDIPEYHDFEKIRQIDKQLVTHDYSPTPIGESYRALRTQLMFSKKTGKIQSLVLTSFQAGDGKSFTASNLAIIMAQQKTNTLIVDADLRRGVLHNTFSANKEPGLTNYLSNKATLASIVQNTHIPNLSIISCGSMIPNPSELLGLNQMRRFLEETKRKFDLIVFDTPPLDAATDAVVLGAQANAVVVVVRSGVTKKSVAKEKLEIFETIPANLIGVILNGTETAIVNNSYSYYHY